MGNSLDMPWEDFVCVDFWAFLPFFFYKQTSVNKKISHFLHWDTGKCKKRKKTSFCSCVSYKLCEVMLNFALSDFNKTVSIPIQNVLYLLCLLFGISWKYKWTIMGYECLLHISVFFFIFIHRHHNIYFTIICPLKMPYTIINYHSSIQLKH